MEISSSNIKKFLALILKFLIFSQKKAFLIFRETKTPKKFLIFQEAALFYTSGNGNPKKLLIFQDVTFQARKIKNTHSRKMYYILGNGTF